MSDEPRMPTPEPIDPTIPLSQGVQDEISHTLQNVGELLDDKPVDEPVAPPVPEPPPEAEAAPESEPEVDLGSIMQMANQLAAARQDRIETVAKVNPTSAAAEQFGAITGDLTGAIERLNQEYTDKTMRDYQKALGNPNTLAAKMAEARNREEEATDLLTLAILKDKTTPLTSPRKELAVRSGKLGSKVSGRLSAADSKLMVAARLGGFRELPLLNSGFRVMLRPLTMAELYSFYRECQQTDEELGRMFNVAYYAYTDFYLKRKFLELFRGCVVQSNLVGWDKGNTFIDHLSMHDYDSCMLVMASMIYKTTKLTLSCAQPGCDFALYDQEVDIRNMRVDDYSACPDVDMLIQLISQPVVTSEEVMAYQRHEKFKRVLNYNHEDTGPIKYKLEIPTATRYLTCSELLVNSALVLTKTGDDDMTATRRDQILLSLHRMMMPWVVGFVAVNDDGSDWDTVDNDAILASLDEVHADAHPTLETDIHSFIRDTKISYVAYTPIVCPKCGATANTLMNANGLKPFNVFALFFVLASIKVYTTLR